MPTERLSMRHIREVLRLHYSVGMSQRAIARSLNLAQGTVSKCAGLQRPLVQVTEHLSGLAEPTARGRDLCGISTMLVVAVLWSFRGPAFRPRLEGQKICPYGRGGTR